MDRQLLEKRPAVFVIGSENVGKRTLLSHRDELLSVDFEEICEQSRELLVHGWTIDTKYYTADVSVWMAHLNDESSTFPIVDRAVALVMVFDINEPSSLAALKDWVSHIETRNFDILICIGNKVDLVPDHPVHMEYKRRLMKHGESSIDPLLGSSEYGISETEGSSLLRDEEPMWELKRSCLEWCLKHNIEYVEACASNAEFDKLPSSLAALKDCVSHIETRNFDILICIGNKVDLVPDHPVHMEYKRRLMKHGESSIDPLLGSSEYGISETEGSSLLRDEEPMWELKRSCLEWCLKHNIEYVEACASNAEFDKCLSVDGDSQGVERLYGALAAHMWPGMLLKSGDRINEPSLPDREG
ncbi:hypothetical protein OROGR_012105 [Orobanche gracilis]